MATFYASVPVIPVYCAEVGITGSKIGIVFTSMSVTTVLQPLFQSLVTGATPVRNRGTANATYMLSYDIGIGIGSLCMGFVQNTIGLSTGFALTAIAYIAASLIFLCYTDGYYRKLLQNP